MKVRGHAKTITIAAVVVVGVLLTPLLFFAVGGYQASRMVDRVLSRTDHEALLQAGRNVLRQLPRSENGALVSSRLPSREHLPQALRDLSARVIMLDPRGFLHVEMHGGMSHFGFNLYPEDFNEADPFFWYGDRKIIDGLWYYDQECRDPRYAKRVEALLAKNQYGHRRLREGSE
jgi:hypothetical protein